MQPQIENYKDIKIHYVAVPFIQGLEPSYSFMGNYLVMGVSRDPLREAIDVFKNSAPSITAKQGFQDAGPGLLEKNNSIFYLQFDELVVKLQGVIEWMRKWMDTENTKREAFKSGSEKRIADLKLEIVKNEQASTALNTQLKTINDQIKQAVTASVAVPPETPGTDSTTVTTAPVASPQTDVKEIEKKRTAMEEKITAIQKNLQADKDKIIELGKSIKSYDTQTTDIQERKIIVEQLIRPALKILSSVKSLATRMIFSDNLIETYFYLKFE